jgi:hypothetical protein
MKLPGNLRWGTPSHPHGCDHLWASPMDLEDMKRANPGIVNLRVAWCLFCGRPNDRAVDRGSP